MPSYMDKEGFQRKDWKDSPKSIRRAEKWIKEILDRGATIPEAMWDIMATFGTAFENVRFDLIKKKTARKTK